MFNPRHDLREDILHRRRLEQSCVDVRFGGRTGRLKREFLLFTELDEQRGLCDAFRLDELFEEVSLGGDCKI